MFFLAFESGDIRSSQNFVVYDRCSLLFTPLPFSVNYGFAVKVILRVSFIAFGLWTGQDFVRLLGWVVRQLVNANPGLKANRSINSSCIIMFLTGNILYSLSLLKLKTEGQTV